MFASNIMPSARSVRHILPILINKRLFSLSCPLEHIVKLTRLKVVDNSALGIQAVAEGKPCKCIHIYNKKGIGTLGDLILVAIKGQKQKAVIVGVKRTQKAFIPRFDTNNVVLVDHSGNPIGTRITAPIPSFLRGRPEYSKLIAIASHFV